ncbi:histidine--tRNA ligase [Candidatus Kaiserbacteria bacterium]|nr:histidine--tRNA ligase [Candidatus Kaiserbacteria bacterium]MCB9812676.1 histidine--tRNA ligase [Candidatus Nomurabacteria bacterium]
MSDNKLSTDSYKGVRDFYPEDMAIQRYIFQTWSKTAESFGFERYDASILEPSALYKAKGAENEELVNEQTYTFTDRGDREVTLRPEMTPTVARMIAGQRHELTFPVRWYSIPNLFRYERPQRGRLREFWQFNCDLFGVDDVSADIELIALAHQTIIDFGATPDMFEIRINDRSEMNRLYGELGITDSDTIAKITRLNDQKAKIDRTDYQHELAAIVGDEALALAVISLVEDNSGSSPVLEGLRSLGVTNAYIDRTIARGFNYYTGTVFELFDTAPENNRALLGGGRFDNLTTMFSGDAISGIGFGMGDVPMRDFLEVHQLIPEHIRTTAPQVMIIPMEAEQNLYAEQVAMHIRQAGHKVATDISTRKVGKKIGSASDRGVKFVIVIGEAEMQSGDLTVKHLASGQEHTGPLDTLMNSLDMN